MNEEPAALHFAGSHMSYGRRHVLRGLDLTVTKGDIFSL